jgi:ABC-type Fe3+ transport system substrate-binding protein
MNLSFGNWLLLPLRCGIKLGLPLFAALTLGGFAPAARAQVGNPELVAQAKKEGGLMWYTTISIPEAKEFADAFEKLFPFVKIDIFRSGAGAVANRVASEYMAKSYKFDIVQGISSRGVIPAFKRKEIIGRYHSPEYKFVAADLKDKEGFWTAMNVNTLVLAYNTRMVKPPDAPKTYDDLLKPAWKGKKILNDTENFAWFDELLKYWGRDKGVAYFRKLAQQEQVFQRGSRSRIQLVMAGEFPLTIAYGPHIQGYTSRAAPIDWVPLEPVVFVRDTISVAGKPPHPASAKLFVDFLFSKESQLKLREMNRIPARMDVEPDPPRLFQGFKRIPQDIEQENLTESINLFREIFGLPAG